MYKPNQNTFIDQWKKNLKEINNKKKFLYKCYCYFNTCTLCIYKWLHDINASLLLHSGCLNLILWRWSSCYHFCFSCFSGITAELYYVRNGIINSYALGFEVPISPYMDDIYFTWQNLCQQRDRPCHVSHLEFLLDYGKDSSFSLWQLCLSDM